MPPLPLHILYVFPEPLPLARARGGQVAQVVRAMAACGCRVTLAYVPSGDDHPFVPIGVPVPEGVALLPLSRQLPGLPFKSHRLFMWRLGRWVKEAVRRGQAPDVAFFRHIKAAAFWASAFPELPMVYEAHEVFGKTAKPSQRQRLQSLEGAVLAGAALVLANSRGSADGLAALYGIRRPILVLPNGVDYPERLPEKPWGDAKRNIVYAGSLFGWKGVDDLVAAAGALPGYRIRIIGGTAEQMVRLRSQSPAGGAELEFLGQLPQHAVQAHLAAAAVAVLPNRPDTDSQFTSPLKLFEYLAAGCAVVATDLPAMREILGQQDAIWAAPGDPQSLAQAIAAACSDPERLAALGLRGRALVKERTWQRRSDLLLAAMRDALAPASALAPEKG